MTPHQTPGGVIITVGDIELEHQYGRSTIPHIIIKAEIAELCSLTEAPFLSGKSYTFCSDSYHFQLRSPTTEFGQFKKIEEVGG